MCGYTSRRLPAAAPGRPIDIFGLATLLVALAALAGAAIAKGKPMKTALNATKLAIGAFIIPYIFVFSPAMLMINTDLMGSLSISMSAIIGMFAISAALEGYVFRKESIVERILFAIAGFSCVIPGYMSDVFGFIIIGSLIAYQIIRNRAEKAKA